MRGIGLKATTFEHLCILDADNGVRYILIYRPPSSTENGFKSNQLLEEIDDLLDAILLYYYQVVSSSWETLMCMLTFQKKNESNHLLTYISSAGLLQHVTEPTH